MQQLFSKPRVCKSSLSQVSSSHVEGTSQGSVLKNDSLLPVDIQNLIESRKKKKQCLDLLSKHKYSLLQGGRFKNTAN